MSIGPSETMHFQTWQDKAGNATPLNFFDPVNKSTAIFVDLTKAQGETDPESTKGDILQANLIMPEPTHFLSKDFGPVAIIRPTSRKNSSARAASIYLAINRDPLLLRPVSLRDELAEVP